MEVVSFKFLGIVLTCIHALGLLSAINAVATTRTSQGATAWAISLISFPYVSLPLYWIFGRNKFHGYVRARRSGNAQLAPLVPDLVLEAAKFAYMPVQGAEDRLVLESLVRTPFTVKNGAKLLVDGDATFSAIFEGIESATKYVLVQFFIIRDDGIGRDLKNTLLRAAARGVPCFLLYDEVGSHSLPKAYVEELRKAGVQVSAFKTNRGLKDRFQLNFRNHRKIVIVDGHLAFIGGLNVGDEYMGRSERFGHWRDTHVRFEGPSVMGAQLSFVEDWYWATQTVPTLSWQMIAATEGDMPALSLPTGPADSLETCSLMFTQLINIAKERLWIASPYFVPDGPTLAALQLAALRGVDVRIILPEKADHKIVYLAAFSYLQQMEAVGVRVYRYLPGFMHQKVILVDDKAAAVGTANCDNRSFRLNFEITMLFADKVFASQVADMLLEDFTKARLVPANELKTRSLWFRFCVRASRLLSPIL